MRLTLDLFLPATHQVSRNHSFQILKNTLLGKWEERARYYSKKDISVCPKARLSRVIYPTWTSLTSAMYYVLWAENIFTSHCGYHNFLKESTPTSSSIQPARSLSFTVDYNSLEKNHSKDICGIWRSIWTGNNRALIIQTSLRERARRLNDFSQASMFTTTREHILSHSKYECSWGMLFTNSLVIYTAAGLFMVTFGLKSYGRPTLIVLCQIVSRLRFSSCSLSSVHKCHEWG